MRRFVDHQDKRERLGFLCRVVKKEIQHLQYSAGKVFKDGFTEERARQIANDEEFAEQWLELRQLRNQMIHEYIEDLAILTDALQTAYQHLSFIVDVAESIIKDLEKRSLI